MCVNGTMAQPEPFIERFDVLQLYKERFCVAFPTGHRPEQQNRVRGRPLPMARR